MVYVAKEAVNTLFEKAKLSPQGVDEVELHDCFAANELSILLLG